MCGGSGGFDIGAFNPLADWKHKKWWEKATALGGLPVGNNVASPKWIKAHPKEAAAAAAVAATVFSGGAAAGLWGGAAAGGAAAGGVGASEAAAAAAGEGAMLGSTLGGAGFSAEAGAGLGATPGLFSGGAGAWGGAGLADGASVAPLVTESADPLASLGGIDPHAMENGIPDFNTLGAKADVWKAKAYNALTHPSGMGGLRGAYLANSLMSKQQTPMPVATRPAPQAFAPLSDSLKPIYGHVPQPGDPDYLEYLRRKQYGY